MCRVCCCTDPPVQEKPCWPELLLITPTAPSSGCLAPSWSRSSLERVSSWLCLCFHIFNPDHPSVPTHKQKDRTDVATSSFPASLLPVLHQAPAWCASCSSWPENTLLPSSSWTRSTPSGRRVWREAQAATARCRGQCWSCSISWTASKPPRTSRYDTDLVCPAAIERIKISFYNTHSCCSCR